MSRRVTKPEERFWGHVNKNGPFSEALGSRCWDWTAALMYQGYGHFGVTSKNVQRAHRYSYEINVGPIPPGYFVDHLCFRPPCVNPSHLEAVTPKTNNERRRGANRNSKSGVRGVWYDSSRGVWCAEVGSSKLGKRRGRFPSFESAREAAAQWRAEMFGLERGSNE